MDRRLFEASHTGNVGELHQLLKENPLILHVVSLTSVDTPLHVASMAGHLNFVKEMVRLKPEFAVELNQDGFNPLHIASANGYIEIVKELLKINRDHCHLKSRDRRTALHFASMKGRADVIRELVSTCPESVEDVTIRGETALHLAVKNNQTEAFEVLVEKMKHLRKEDLLNWKDEQGNNVLHLATCTKQREVVELLLANKDPNTIDLVDVNAINESRLTALDILQTTRIEEGDREIEEILRSVGAKKARDVVPPIPTTRSQVLPNNLATLDSSRSPFNRLVDYFKFKRARDSPSDVRNALLVIAVLIATATYQAGLSPPGGVWQDDYNSTDTTIRSHHAGKAILGTKNTVSFALFLFCNSAGFYTSLFMIQVLTSGFPLKLELEICILAMIVTYDTAMLTISPNGGLSTSFNVISVFFPMSLPLIARWMRLFWEKKRDLRSLGQWGNLGSC